MSDLVGTVEIEKNNELVPGNNEVLKNRVFGMPTSKMTRHQRVSFTAMVKIAYDLLSVDPNQKVFEFNTQEFIKMIGLTPSMKHNHLFSKVFVDEEGWEQESEEYALEKTLRELITKEIVFRFKDDNGKTYKVEATALLAYFKLTREKVTFEFSEWIRSRILTTNNAYIMKIPIIASFKSGYTVTLFEQLEQRRDFKRWEVSVKVLRKIFGLEDDKYKRFGNFRARVLDVAKDEINDKTNYLLAYELVKIGRRVEKIIFTWYINKNSFVEWKEFMRKNFVDTPLIELPGQDKTMHLIQISKDGKLYNARKPDMYYSTEKANIIWKWMYDNQNLLITHQKRMLKNKDYSGKDYSEFYGKNLLLDDEMYHHIIFITPTEKANKIKIKFKTGELMIMDEDEFKESVIF